MEAREPGSEVSVRSELMISQTKLVMMEVEINRPNQDIGKK